MVPHLARCHRKNDCLFAKKNKTKTDGSLKLKNHTVQQQSISTCSNKYIINAKLSYSCVKTTSFKDFMPRCIWNSYENQSSLNNIK